VYEPGNPDADDKGFVSLPGINQVTEMVNMAGALRAYEANVVAMNAAKTMALKALELGGGQ
jgi:flagellar basal-body rod protein FlgC